MWDHQLYQSHIVSNWHWRILYDRRQEWCRLLIVRLFVKSSTACLSPLLSLQLYRYGHQPSLLQRKKTDLLGSASTFESEFGNPPRSLTFYPELTKFLTIREVAWCSKRKIYFNDIAKLRCIKPARRNQSPLVGVGKIRFEVMLFDLMNSQDTFRKMIAGILLNVARSFDKFCAPCSIFVGMELFCDWRSVRSYLRTEKIWKVFKIDYSNYAPEKTLWIIFSTIATHMAVEHVGSLYSWNMTLRFVTVSDTIKIASTH